MRASRASLPFLEHVKAESLVRELASSVAEVYAGWKSLAYLLHLCVESEHPPLLVQYVASFLAWKLVALPPAELLLLMLKNCQLVV